MRTIEESNKTMGNLVEEAMFFGKTGSKSKNSVLRKIEKDTENYLTDGGRFPLTDELKIEVNDAHGLAGVLSPSGQKASLRLIDELQGGVSLELKISTDGAWRILNKGQVVGGGEDLDERVVWDAWLGELLKNY